MRPLARLSWVPAIWILYASSLRCLLAQVSYQHVIRDETPGHPIVLQLPSTTLKLNRDTLQFDALEGEPNEEDQQQLARLYLSLHRALYRKGVLPRKGVFTTKAGQSLPRQTVGVFIRNISDSVGRGSRCLEWGVGYVAKLDGKCKENWSIEYTRADPYVDFTKKRLYGAIDQPMPKSWKAMVGYFDLVVCTQVFEHIRFPHMASKVLFALIKPRGQLAWTAPFMEPDHKVPEDHFRYTQQGAVTLFEGAGFVAKRVYLGGGSSELATARLLGFTKDDLDEEAQQDMLVEWSEWAKRKQSVHEKIYWGVYLLMQKPAAGP